MGDETAAQRVGLGRVLTGQQFGGAIEGGGCILIEGEGVGQGNVPFGGVRLSLGVGQHGRRPTHGRGIVGGVVGQVGVVDGQRLGPAPGPPQQFGSFQQRPARFVHGEGV